MRVLPISVALVAATAPAFADEPPVEARLSNELVQLGEVLFAFDRSEVREDFADEIAKFTEFSEEHPDAKIVIDAHTDPVGASDYNAALGVRRARAVKLALTTRGVDPERIIITSFGEDALTGQSNQRERRVDVSVTTAPLYAILTREMGAKAITVVWDEPVEATAMVPPKSGEVIVIREGGEVPQG